MTVVRRTIMPIEHEQLHGAPVMYTVCPLCDDVFDPFLRGLVQRSKRRWWWPFGKEREHCAVICRSCKRIVGWERP